MLRTGSPEEMIEFYREAFGFELREKKEMETFTLYFLRAEDQTAEIELTYNHGKDEKYEKGSVLTVEVKKLNQMNAIPTTWES